MSESEDAIRKAEDFLREQEKDKPVLISLPCDRAKLIKDHLYSYCRTTMLEIDTAIFRVTGERRESFTDDESLEGHEDNMLVILHKRFDEVLTQQANTPNVAIPLNAREIDFLNSHLKPEKRSPDEDKSPKRSVYTPDVSSEEVETWFKEISFRDDTEGMASYISLNLAFIRAGGEARQDFVYFYEGNLT